MTGDDYLRERARYPELRVVDVAKRLGVNYNTFRARMSEARRGIVRRRHQPAPDFRQYHPAVEDVLTIRADNCIVTGDIQLPTTSQQWVELMCEVADSSLPEAGRTLIIAGDLVNNDAFSSYEPEDFQPTLSQEYRALQAFLDYVTEYFERVYWFYGNHERRAQKRTGNIIPPYLFAAMMLGRHAERVTVSKYGYAFLETRERWLLSHQREYSRLQLKTANQLAQAYQMNVVAFHQHHLAHGYDDYKRYQVIDAGGLFAREAMGYATLDPTTKARMSNGFVLFRNGYPHLFGPPGFTDYELWLGAEGRRTESVA